MSLLFESIKILDGIALNLEYHQRRMDRSLACLHVNPHSLDLQKYIKVPKEFLKDKVKAKLIYDLDSIKSIEFSHYEFKKASSYKIIQLDHCNYALKYQDRSCLDNAFQLRGTCDDIIISVNGLIADSYYANLVFKDEYGKLVTPADCLLKGTKRAFYLDREIIVEKRISIASLKEYTHVCRINALMDLGEDEWVELRHVVYP